MKWPRKVFFLLLLALIGWLVVWLYPFVQPLLQHPPKSGWLTLIVYDLLTSKQNQDLIHSPMLWILLCIGGLMLLMMEIETRTRRTDTHGSAHPATRSEIRPFVHITQRFPRVPRLPQVPLPRIGMSKQPAKRQRTVPEARLVLGTSRGKVISLSEEQQESNVFLVAPIGAGKTSLIVIRNILRERGTRSLLIPDVKGELVRVTAGAVAEHHEVWVFDPVHPNRSDGYNPLAYIHTIEDAQEYARCWVANTGKSPEEFWLDAARDLMAWTMMHLHAAEPQAPFGRIADILCGLTYPRLKSAFLDSPSQKVRELALPFFDYMDKNPKLIGSLMVDLSTRFQLLVSDHVRDITARNQIDFLAMTERPVALYLSIPRRYAERYQPLLACMVMQMFATWEEQTDTSPTGRLPHQIMCYMDEFANLGYIPNMSGYITTARHTGVGILLAVQNYAQLDEKYGRAVRESILTNTKTHLLLPGGGLEETEYYSRRIGNTTVRTETHSVSGSGIEKRETWTQGETGRRLMTPDELRTMAADKMLMINATTAPMVLRTTPYYQDREVMHRANLPFPHVRVYQRSSPPPQTLPGSSTRQTAKQPSTALDSDQDNKQDNDQYFLQE